MSIQLANALQDFAMAFTVPIAFAIFFAVAGFSLSVTAIILLLKGRKDESL